MNTTTEYKPRGSSIIEEQQVRIAYQNLYEKNRYILYKLLDIYDLSDLDQIVDCAKEYKEEHEEITEKLDKIFNLLQ